MKISILTPSFNQAAYIEDNILSVLKQNWYDVEHIIIDGGSTDNTINILKKYRHLRWISEPDCGQADALNKGLSYATGDIIGWINSDDYYQENIFDDVILHFQDDEVKWLIGDITYIYEGHRFHTKSNNQFLSYEKLIKCPDILTQQGVFFRKSTLDSIGGWDETLHMVMDFELWIRMLKNDSPKIVKRNYAYFRMHPHQKTSYKNTFLQISEINRVFVKNKVNIHHRYNIMMIKIFYYLKSVLKYILISFGLIDKKFSMIPMTAYKLNK